MADNRSPASKGNPDLTAREKTYRGFLRLLKFSLGTSVLILLLLYFFLAR